MKGLPGEYIAWGEILSLHIYLDLANNAEQGGDATPTAYFALLMTSLSESAEQDVEMKGAILYLLSLVFDR